jgi:hypothetical protein
MAVTWPSPESISEFVQTCPKAPVTDLITLAQRSGWKVTVTYARGCWPSVGGRPSRQRDSYGVRMWRGAHRAVAIYVEGVATEGAWGWETLLSWTLDTFPHGHANSTVFQDAVFGQTVKPAWPGPKDWSCPYFGPAHGPVKPKRVPSAR